jgi:hypothetical protein
MALIFPVRVRQVNGHYEAETPALPGWSAAGAGVEQLLGQARSALEKATPTMEVFEYAVARVDGVQVHEVAVEEPWSWYFKPPNE